jgi:hypothetical protein
VQALSEVHETALSIATAGVVCIVQLVPSHRSTKAEPPAAVPGLLAHPVAVHAAADVQETAFSDTSSPAGLGVLWVDQVVPSQRSANVSFSPVGAVNCPTTVQVLLDAQETALSSPRSSTTAFGVGWIDHGDP